MALDTVAMVHRPPYHGTQAPIPWCTGPHTAHMLWCTGPHTMVPGASGKLDRGHRTTSHDAAGAAGVWILEVLQVAGLSTSGMMHRPRSHGTGVLGV